MGLEAAAMLAGGLGSRLQGRDAAFTIELSHWHFLPLLIIVALLAWIDLVRRDELLFLGNLGIGPRSLIACYLFPALVLESLLTVLL